MGSIEKAGAGRTGSREKKKIGGSRSLGLIEKAGAGRTGSGEKPHSIKPH